MKLTDCRLNQLLTKLRKVITKRKPFYFISQPNLLSGKKNLRMLRNHIDFDINASAFGDIYNLGVFLLLMIVGNIEKLVKNP